MPIDWHKLCKEGTFLWPVNWHKLRHGHMEDNRVIHIILANFARWAYYNRRHVINTHTHTHTEVSNYSLSDKLSNGHRN